MTSPKILIVDDEPFNVDYLEQELEDSHYEIISAGNGQEALEKVRSESPDLILLDIMMPVMDGFEVLSRLKPNPSTRDIPVIVISANSDVRSMVKGIQLGAEDYLPKPFEPVLLHARISSSLEKKRLRDLQQLYLKSLERELDIAREIQKGFLPSELPRVVGWEIAAYFKAAREVAGDFYDAFPLPDGNLVCVVGDVCDKGVGAALFMTLFRSLIRVTSTTELFSGENKTNTLTPTERLNHVITFTNNYLNDTHGDAYMFATIFIGILNTRDGTLTYVNCGNEPALVLGKGNTVTTLPPTGPVVGIIPDASYSVKEIILEENDLFLAFTDGIPDCKNAGNDFFGTQRLIDTLHGRNISPLALVDKVEEQLHQFIGTADQFDDITLLAIKRNPQGLVGFS
ncbi:MAG TPA: SpoIIE family protein phosphatase [Anaerolineales bacterium]|jgi:serine phosphatase RsbU (regulator of sigma subunit)